MFNVNPHSCCILSDTSATFFHGPQSHVWRRDFNTGGTFGSAAIYLQACFFPFGYHISSTEEADGSHGGSQDGKGSPRMHCFLSEQMNSRMRKHELSFTGKAAGCGRDLMRKTKSLQDLGLETSKPSCLFSPPLLLGTPSLKRLTPSETQWLS